VIILANPKINNKFQYFKFNLFFIELDLNKFKHIIPINNFSSGILHKIIIINIYYLFEIKIFYLFLLSIMQKG
jgi:hypothetical protein